MINNHNPMYVPFDIIYNIRTKKYKIYGDSGVDYEFSNFDDMAKHMKDIIKKEIEYFDGGDKNA